MAFAYIPCSGNVVVIDMETDTIVGLVPAWGRDLAVTPDGSYAYLLSLFFNSVQAIQTAGNAIVATIPVGASPISVAVTPDGVHVYVTDVDGTLSVISTITNSVVATVASVGQNLRGIAAAPDGERVFVIDLTGGVLVINRQLLSVVATVPVGHLSSTIAVAPDGNTAYVTNSDGTVSVINTNEYTVAATVVTPDVDTPGEFFGYGVEVAPDGEHVYLTGSGSVLVIETAGNTVVANVPVGGLPAGVAVTPDGQRVFIANYNSGTSSVIATATNAVVATIPAGGCSFQGKVIADPDPSMAPPPLVHLTLNPVSVIAGQLSMGTVTLYPYVIIPAGGLKITLSSDTPTVAAVPSSPITILPGDLAASFPIVTGAGVPPDNGVLIYAAAADIGSDAYARLTVSPQPGPPGTVAFVSVPPDPVVFGQEAPGSVTINPPALPQDVIVGLTSSAPAVAAVPASVTIPAGYTSASFPITTSVPPKAGSPNSLTVKITASAGGVTRIAELVLVTARLARLPYPPPRGGPPRQ
jgi:YVTN family beta-propeller protein